MASLRLSRAEAANWFWHRLSGLLLVVGMVIHFWMLHFSNAGEVTYREVISRLQTPLWQTFDTLLLGVVLYHAMLGIRLVLLDFGFLRRYRRLIVWGLWIVGIGLFYFGLDIIRHLPSVT